MLILWNLLNQGILMVKFLSNCLESLTVTIMTCWAITKYLLYERQRIYSFYRNQSGFLLIHDLPTWRHGVASGAGTTNPSEAPEFTLVGFMFHNSVLCCVLQITVSHVVLFLLAIVVSIFLQLTTSDRLLLYLSNFPYT